MSAEVRSYSLLRPFLILLGFLIFTGGSVLAQENGNGKIPSPPFDLTKEAINNRIKSLEEQEGLDEKTLENIKSTYQKALTELSTIESFTQRISEYKSISENGSSEVEKYNRQLEELQSEPELNVPEKAPIDQLFKEIEKTDTYIPTEPELSFLQQELNDRQSELSSVQSNLEDVTAKLNDIKSRRENIQNLLNEAKDKLEEVTTSLKGSSLPDSPGEQAIADLVLLHVRKKKLETQINALNLEKETYDLRRDLLQARQKYLTARKNRLGKLVQLWQMVVSQNMERKAKEDLEETKEALNQVKESYPLIEDLAQKITELAEERASDDGPIQGIQQITERLKSTQSIRQSISTDLANVKERIRAAGLTHQLGTILRRKKDELPVISDHRKDISSLEQERSDVQLRLIELNETRSNLLQDRDEIIESELKKTEADLSDSEKQQIRSKITDLLTRRLGLIEKLIEEYDRYFTKITDLIAEKRKLVGVLQDYHSYINERVIWIRSTSNFFNVKQQGTGKEKSEVPDCRTPKGIDANVRHVPAAIRCLLQWSHLTNTYQVLVADVKASYLFYITVLIVLSLLLWFRPTYFERLKDASKGTFSRFEDSFLKTANALLNTFFLAVPVPLFLLFIGWRLSVMSGTEPNFTYAVGIAFAGAGLYMFTISALRHTCHPDGLGRNHFRWAKENIRLIRKNVLYFLYPTIPLVFLFVLTNHIDNRFYRDSLGRLLFIVTMLLITWFIKRVLSPNSGIISDYLEQHTGGWLDRMRYIWYPLVVGIPLALGLLAVFGYYYTARQLMYRLSLSFVAFLGLLYAVELFVRWQLYKNIQYAVQKREEQKEQAAKQEKEGEDGAGLAEIEQESFSLPSVNDQTQQLLWSFFWVGLLVGFWFIWADVLPALGLLNEVELWTHPEQVLETVSGDDGQSIQRTIERQTAVTLADVLLGLLIIVMTVVVSKNLPGLLEITLLHYLPMDQGLRYAYKTISRYLIVVIGIVSAAAMFGIRWGDIQWLVAGISVGLGFGLQEIFANFVSGIILLFERPIRVGDTITINEVTGKVTRIRTRATTIQDLDRKELVVPNRDFIQGELVNWTLSDSIMRVVIPIGVAYGSDTDLVEKKLMEITKKEDIVLNDPAPNVIFTGFGDNTLNFSLRFFIDSYDNYWKAFHHVNRAVDKSFREAGITIAFPQRDLHVKSVEDDVSVSFSPDEIPAENPDETAGEDTDTPEK